MPRVNMGDAGDRRRETGDRDAVRLLEDALLAEDGIEVCTSDKDAGGARVERWHRAVLHPAVEHLGSAKALGRGGDEHGTMETGRFQFSQFVDAIGPVDADSDDVFRWEPAVFGGAHG